MGTVSWEYLGYGEDEFPGKLDSGLIFSGKLAFGLGSSGKCESDSEVDFSRISGSDMAGGIETEQTHFGFVKGHRKIGENVEKEIADLMLGFCRNEGLYKTSKLLNLNPTGPRL